jgi:hypothetical protein
VAPTFPAPMTVTSGWDMDKRLLVSWWLRIPS